MTAAGTEAPKEATADTAQESAKKGEDVLEKSPSDNLPGSEEGKEENALSSKTSKEKQEQRPVKDPVVVPDASGPLTQQSMKPPRSSISPTLVPPRGPIVIGFSGTTAKAPLPAAAASAAPTPARAKTATPPPVTATVPPKITNAPKPVPSPTTTTATKPAPSKKRPNPSTATTTPSTATSQRPVMTPHTPLADPAVVKTVHDIVGLLQTYGPLTFGQLEYNLPPISTLQDILQVMVTIGVVQVIDDNSDTVRYTMLKGIPRSDVVLPQTVVDDILDAQTEVTRTKERCRILREALLSTTKNTREVLKQVLLEFPEIANDPIYVAALRNVHVDMAAVERERLKKQRIMSSKEKETSKNAEDASKGDSQSAPEDSKKEDREVQSQNDEESLDIKI